MDKYFKKEEQVELPSGQVIKLKKINGGQWKDCLIYNVQQNARHNLPQTVDLFYWDKFLELSSGWTRKKLDSMPKEDAEFLLDYFKKTEQVGPEGLRETDENRKN